MQLRNRGRRSQLHREERAASGEGEAGAVRGLQTPHHHSTTDILCCELSTSTLCVGITFTITQLILITPFPDVIAPSQRQENWDVLNSSRIQFIFAWRHIFWYFSSPLYHLMKKPGYEINGLGYSWRRVSIVICGSHPVFHKGNSSCVCLVFKTMLFSCPHIALPLFSCHTRWRCMWFFQAPGLPRVPAPGHSDNLS